MPPEKHALLSASSAARWLNCTAAPRFEEGLPESTSEYAEEGRLAHAIAELKTLKKFTLMTSRTYTTRLNKLKKEPLYNPEMDKTTDLYMEHITEQAMLYDSAPTVAAEVKVDFNDYVPPVPAWIERIAPQWSYFPVKRVLSRSSSRRSCTAAKSLSIPAAVSASSSDEAPLASSISVSSIISPISPSDFSRLS